VGVHREQVLRDLQLRVERQRAPGLSGRRLQRAEFLLESRHLAVERVGDRVPDQLLADAVQVGEELVLRFPQQRLAGAAAIERRAARCRVRRHDALLVRVRRIHARRAEHELAQVLGEGLAAALVECRVQQHVIA
jgi:hypothetical protein